MEPEGSLPHSQVPATFPCPEPARSFPYPHIPLPEDPSYYHPPIYARVSKVVLSLKFPHQNPVYASSLPIRATCPAHLILLDFITRKILGEKYRSLVLLPERYYLNFPLCGLIHTVIRPISSFSYLPVKHINPSVADMARDQLLKSHKYWQLNRNHRVKAMQSVLPSLTKVRYIPNTTITKNSRIYKLFTCILSFVSSLHTSVYYSVRFTKYN